MFKKLCELLPRIPPDQRSELICQIHNEAGRLPYLDDLDQGAVLLEMIGDQTDDSELRLLCYTHAVYRARWSAQSSTNDGGAGTAINAHFKLLQNKRKKAEQETSDLSALVDVGSTIGSF